MAAPLFERSHRYIISIAVADYSGQAWLQGFNEVGQALFGVSANELNRLKVCWFCIPNMSKSDRNLAGRPRWVRQGAPRC